MLQTVGFSDITFIFVIYMKSVCCHIKANGISLNIHISGNSLS